MTVSNRECFPNVSSGLKTRKPETKDASSRSRSAVQEGFISARDGNSNSHHPTNAVDQGVLKPSPTAFGTAVDRVGRRHVEEIYKRIASFFSAGAITEGAALSAVSG